MSDKHEIRLLELAVEEREAELETALAHKQIELLGEDSPFSRDERDKISTANFKAARARLEMARVRLEMKREKQEEVKRVVLAARKACEERLRERIGDLTAENAVLSVALAQHKEREERLRERIGDLTAENAVLSMALAQHKERERVSMERLERRVKNGKKKGKG